MKTKVISVERGNGSFSITILLQTETTMQVVNLKELGTLYIREV